LMNEKLAHLHFLFSFIPINVIFILMLRVGIGGMQRRLYNPSVYNTFLSLYETNVWASRFAYLLFFGQIFFIWNFFYSMYRGKKASNNPWEVGTLEWTIPSPPPHHNYDTIPVVVNGPHEFNNPAVKDKDWLAQDEPLPEGPAAGTKSA